MKGGQPALPRHQFPCHQTDGRHAWGRIAGHPTSKATVVCWYCCVVVHTLPCGKHVVLAPMYVSEAREGGG